jgi:hypothetical protein
MGLLDKNRKKKSDAAEPAVANHAMVVQFNFASGNLDRIFEVEDQLAKAVEGASAGELEGNEIAVDGRDCLFYLYGPDADRLYAAVEPVLLSSELLSEARVLLRYGPPGLDTKQKKITLPKHSTTTH